jgi:nucleoside-diphosphate-sugar epimerase
MRVFVTGATGFIGSSVVKELINTGHQVLGLTRSDSGAVALQAAGAEAHRGDIEDLQSLRNGAAGCEGVIHCAFDHDFSNFAANYEKDGRVIQALGAELEGSNRPLIITSSTGMGNAVPGKPAMEANFDEGHPTPRKASELAGVSVLQQGVNLSVVRLPHQVHNIFKQGLITPLIDIARKKGISAYIGEGLNRWPAVHVLDAARLYRLALEKQQAGARYHAVAEEGIPVRDIAELIGRGLKISVVAISAEEAAAHFGWLGGFVASDLPASSLQTQEQLEWHPTEPGLIADLEQMRY